jgi:hypothetical protein
MTDFFGTQTMEMLTRVHESFGFAVQALKIQFDEQKTAFGNHSEGGYGEELCDAIAAHDELERYLVRVGAEL